MRSWLLLVRCCHSCRCLRWEVSTFQRAEVRLKSSKFESIGVDVSNIQFIDLVSSGILGGTDVNYPNIHFVDSLIMLESVLLRTLYILRTTNTQRNFVFLDSVNALAIYNEDRMLAEYLHLHQHVQATGSSLCYS